MAGGTTATIDPSTARKTLASLRTHQTPTTTTSSEDTVTPSAHYDPSHILALGATVLSQSRSLPSIEHYALLEQLFLAALDCGDTTKAQEYLSPIQSHFPASSVRVQRLIGMLHESQGDYTTASQIYTSALTQDETNTLIRKRLVSVLKAQGNRNEAIERLVEYVDAVMQDVEAWTELAELYLEEGMYAQSAFCYEEVLMLRPAHHLYMIRYADVCATLGRWEVAFKYYCASVEVCRDNVRGLWGMKVASQKVLEKKAGDEVVVKAVGKLAEERLKEVYKGADGEMGGLVTRWLSRN
ncbi:ER membrane complex subunit 2 [Gaertneriomyces sp. JEL0708]|nr:ER membrane complex subunit 2 [Gaertneriomyces sp. JEL0708]